MKKLKLNKKFKTVIAYAKPDKQGAGFTKENLISLAKSVKLPMPITENFNYAGIPVGRCVALKVKDDKLIADVEISDTISKKILNDSCFRVSYTLEPTIMRDISKIDKSNDVYDKEDK